MSLDAHPDREPPMEARVITNEIEFARSSVVGVGGWWPLGQDSFEPLTWAELATRFPDGLVVLP